MRNTKITETENHLHPLEDRWFAIYTRFKREKVVFKELISKGIEAYLPLQKIMRQYGRKKRWVELPLFNSYVFVKIKKENYVSVLSTEGVVRFVKFSQNLIAIPEKEIDIIRKIVDANLSIEVEQRRFIEGDLVEVTRGNLIGMQGTLLKLQRKNKVIIDLVHFGYSLKLELPTHFLRKVKSVVEFVG